MSYLIIDKLKEINQLQNNVKPGEEKTIFSVNTDYLFFERDICKGNLSLKDVDEGQMNLFNITKSLNKNVEKKNFLNKIGLLFSVREKLLNNSRS